MEQFVVETGNGVAVSMKADRVVLGDGTQDARFCYFCIITGLAGFNFRFLFEEDGGQGYRKNTHQDVFQILSHTNRQSKKFHERPNFIIRGLIG